MRVKRVHFTLPPFLRIRDYSFGYRITIPYSPKLCLSNLRRFQDTTTCSCMVLTNESRKICLHTPLGEQGVHEGDALRIVPLV